MNHFARIVVLTIALVLAFTHGHASAQELPGYEPGEVVVKLVQSGDLASVAADFGLAPAPLDQFGARPIYRLQIVDGTLPPDKADDLAGDSRVLYAEANYIQQTPEGHQRVSWARGGDGGDYAEQWAGDFLGLPAARTVTRGAGITVAVLDTGVDRAHPALAGRLLPGYDFVDMDDDPGEVGVSGQDLSYGHGTHVAGLVALVAPDARILPVRVLDRDGAGNIWVLAEALAYAVDPDGDIDTADGAHVINLSLSTLRPTEFVEEIIEDVICDDDDDDDGGDGDGDAEDQDGEDDDGDNDNNDNGDGDGDVDNGDDDDDCLASPGRGAVVIAAAGNRASTTPEYPAAEQVLGLLAVAAHTEADELAAFSNRGAWVQVAAPGDRILSSVPGGEYGVWSGTSMATPLVAGQASLALAAYPTWTAAQVAERIRTSATPGPGGEPPRVDAAAALGLPPTQRTDLPGNGAAATDRLFLPVIRR